MEARPQQLNKLLQLVIWILVLLGLYLSSLYNYLLFHSLAELFSVVIAVGVFAIAWNSRRFLENNYLLYLGIAYLFVGTIDLAHTLAYKGMRIFPGFGANLAYPVVDRSPLFGGRLAVAGPLVSSPPSQSRRIVRRLLSRLHLTVSIHLLLEDLSALFRGRSGSHPLQED